jgi:hypothetical protein
MAFHRIHFLANETPSSKSLNHFKESFICLKLLTKRPSLASVDFSLVLKENNELIAIFIASINTATGGLGRK